MTIKLYLVDQTGGGPRAFQTEVGDLDAANAYIRSAEEKQPEEIYFEQGLMFVGVDEAGREYWQEGEEADDHRLTLREGKATP